MLSACNQAIIHATSDQGLLQQVCELLVGPGGYVMAWVGFAGNDEARSVRPVAQVGFDAGYLGQAGITWADDERGRGPTGTAIRTGTTQVNQDFATDPRMAPWREAARQRGYQSSVALPLREEAGTFGALMIYAREPDAFNAEELQLLEELADDLAFGIRTLRLRAEREAAEAQVRRMNEILETRVQERTAELRDLNEELEAFAYSVSHDLRAPLRVLDGFSSALLDECESQLSGACQDYVRRIRANCRRMERLIESLLRLSRAGRAELRCITVDLSAMAREVSAELAAQEPGRRVVWHIADGVTAPGDPELLRLAVSNLLRNAWKYTSERQEARIEFGRGGDGTLFVRDNGAGFDMAYADRLFKPFQRLHPEARFPGEGVGLAIVWRVIRRHGGRVWAEAAPDRGAAFYFTLPDHPGGNRTSGS